MVLTVHTPLVPTPQVHTHPASTRQANTILKGPTHLASIRPASIRLVSVRPDNILQVNALQDNIPQDSTHLHNIPPDNIHPQVRLHIHQDSILLRVLILQVASIQAAIRHHITRLLSSLTTIDAVHTYIDIQHSTYNDIWSPHSKGHILL